MLKFLRKLFNDRRGNALMIAAAALPLLVGSAGLATDTIQWSLWKRQLQRAADSAAIAGVYDRANNGGGTSTTSTAVSHDLSLNHHTGINLKSGYPMVSFPAGSEDEMYQVKVTLAVEKELAFSSIFLTETPVISTSATAASVPGTSEFCVVSLESSSAKTGIEITGNAGIEMDCSFMSNSPSTNSAYAKGSAKVKADSVAAVGGIQQSANWDVDSYQPYSSELEDPYENIDPRNDSKQCAQTTKVQGNKTIVTNTELDETTDLANAKDANGNKANCFSALKVSAGATLNLPDGTYYIDGGDAFIQGDINCNACTIVLTNTSTADNASIGQFKVNSSAKLNLNAPTSGTYKGIALFQDRRATDSSSNVNKINGNSSSKINGVVYFPSQALDYNGTGNTSAVCTLLVARRLTFSGNSGTVNQFKKGSECIAYGMQAITGGRRVRLIA